MNGNYEWVLKNGRYLAGDELRQGEIAIENGRIAALGENLPGAQEVDLQGNIVLPSLIDGHIHLESAMVSPAEFARTVLPHGTGAVVADPHEIANVLGTKGLDYMLAATEGLPVDVYFMLPSCVPAAPGEENGATLTAADLRPYLDHPRVLGLGEVMDVGSVVKGDPDMLQKLGDAKAAGKRIDGHAPGVTGETLRAYAAAGVSSDHECTSLAEAREKLDAGMWIMIREGTAARNLEALAGLMAENPGRIMLVTDDKHPGDLMAGHLDANLRKAVALGADPVRAVSLVTAKPAEYFGLGHLGAIAPGREASFLITPDLAAMEVLAVWKRGRKVYDRAEGVLPFREPVLPEALVRRAENTFHLAPLTPADFDMSAEPEGPVIGLVPGEITTRKLSAAPKEARNALAVVERHKNTGHIGRAWITGYGLRRGAVATTVAHDSHNLIVVGASPEEMALAAETVRKSGGGLAVVVGERVLGHLALPVAGIMSRLSAAEVEARMEALRRMARELGVSPGIDPFMTLAFVSLPVIPALRLTCGGLVEC